MSKLSEEMEAKLPQVHQNSRLFTITVELLRRSPFAASNDLVSAVMNDAALLRAMVGEDRLHKAAEEFLQRVRVDMRGAATEKDDAEGQCKSVPHVGIAPTSSAKLPGEGHGKHDTHYPGAQSRQANISSEGHSKPVLDIVFASPADTPSPLIPLPKRNSKAMSAVQGIMAKSIVFRLRDGRDIMDVKFHELRKIQRAGRDQALIYAREAMVASYLLEHCPYANPDPHAPVSSYYPVKTIELAVEFANHREATNA